VTSADEPEAHDLPPAQYLAPEVVLLEMAEAGARRSMSLSGWQVLILSRDPATIRSSILRLWVLAAVGNLLGAFVIVALPFWLVSNRHQHTT
jgi:formate/nitrite transporter FocA (FNT family)